MFENYVGALAASVMLDLSTVRVYQLAKDGKLENVGGPLGVLFRREDVMKLQEERDSKAQERKEKRGRRALSEKVRMQVAGEGGAA